MKIMFVTAAVIVGFILVLRVYNGQFSTSVAKGVVAGQLAECGDKPNCVSSQTTQSEFFVEPIQLAESEDWQKLLATLSRQPSYKLVKEEGEYRHYQVTTKVLGFVDDLELLYQPEQQLVQVRSQSRVGYSDLGVNRKRIEWLRTISK